MTSELLAADDATIDDAVAYADPMVLRGLLFQLTGDPDLAEMPVTMRVVGGFREMYRLADRADATVVRAKAAAFLKGHRDSGADARPIGPAERLLQSMSLTAGVDIDPRERDLWVEELAVDPWARGVSWSQEEVPEGAADFSVVVIGAGMGGLNAAVHLKRAGIAVHGPARRTRRSAAPGTRTAIRARGSTRPSRAYTHLFGVDFAYRYPFCPQAENEALLQLGRRPLRASRRHRVRDRGHARSIWDDERPDVGDHRRRARWPSDLAGQRGDQRGRLPVSAQHPEARGHRGLRGRVLPHRPMAGRARPRAASGWR